MLMRQPHSCKTTFAGGVNIFTGCGVLGCITDLEIMKILRESGPCTGDQLSQLLGVHPDLVFGKCSEMVEHELITAIRVPIRKGIKPDNLYLLRTIPLPELLLKFIERYPGISTGKLKQLCGYLRINGSLGKLISEDKAFRKRTGKSYQYWKQDEK